MSFTLLVRSHGRWPYLARAIDSLDLDQFDRKVLSVDGPVIGAPIGSGWEILSTGEERHGLAANVTQAWESLSADDEWVFDLEEDFLLLDVPLGLMAGALVANPDIAQMALVRQPWSPEEHAAGGLLYGPHIAGQVETRGPWMAQRQIFTLNPFVARASLLRSLQPGVEASLTEQCLARGLSFGFWGGPHDAPRVLHIGVDGGMGSPGWRAT